MLVGLPHVSCFLLFERIHGCIFAKKYVMIFIDKNIRWPNGLMGQSMLVEIGDSIGKAVHPPQQNVPFHLL